MITRDLRTFPVIFKCMRLKWQGRDMRSGDKRKPKKIIILQASKPLEQDGSDMSLLFNLGRDDQNVNLTILL